MKAIIIKNIETELKDIENSNYYREAIPVQSSVVLFKDGEYPPTSFQDYREKTYQRTSLINPETNERKEYFVNVDDRSLWNEIVKVSDGFINSAIDKGIQRFRDQFLDYELPDIEETWFNKGKKAEKKRIKKVSWYKRLLNRF